MRFKTFQETIDQYTEQALHVFRSVEGYVRYDGKERHLQEGLNIGCYLIDADVKGEYDTWYYFLWDRTTEIIISEFDATFDTNDLFAFNAESDKVDDFFESHKNDMEWELMFESAKLRFVL
ncbi:MAG: hypothetical protein KAS32_14315 [Candidatus Peribacteraceae bacterium]|nr:hypothetical protein [Candidatus Peribacteraceae bacterium]